MKYKKNKSKIEKVRNLMSGTGLYIYENNTDADLTLPKPSKEGFTKIGPRQRFQGDSYFLGLVKSPNILLRLIEEIKDTTESENIEQASYIEKGVSSKINEEKSEKISKKSKKKTINKRRSKKGVKMKEKLLLDQPDTITQAGKVESFSEEISEEQTAEEKLLTENPTGDIEIISE